MIDQSPWPTWTRPSHLSCSAFKTEGTATKMQTAVAISLNNERTGIICCSRYISAVRLPWCHGIGGNATDNLNDDQGDAGLCRHQTPDRRRATGGNGGDFRGCGST